jgi:hypothetical protein
MTSIRRLCSGTALVLWAVLAGAAHATDVQPAWDGETLPAVSYPHVSAQAPDADGFVPPGWRLELQARGDLDADGQPDLALLLRQRDARNVLRNEGLGEAGFDTNPRMLVVALREGAGYRRILEDHTFIPRRADPVDDDYVQGDDAIAIVRGTLRIRLHAWRSAGGWGTWTSTFNFRWQQGCLRLVGFDRNHLQRNSGQTEDTSINYLTRRATVATGNMEDDAVDTRNVRIAKAPLRCLQDLGSGMDFEPALPAAPQDG